MPNVWVAASALMVVYVHTASSVRARQCVNMGAFGTDARSAGAALSALMGEK